MRDASIIASSATSVSGPVGKAMAASWRILRKRSRNSCFWPPGMTTFLSLRLAEKTCRQPTTVAHRRPLTVRPGDAEPNIDIAVRRRVVGAQGGTHIRPVMGKRPTADHAVQAGGNRLAVFLVLHPYARIRPSRILAPTPHVAVHVKQPQVVRTLLPHRPGATLAVEPEE